MPCFVCTACCFMLDSSRSFVQFTSATCAAYIFYFVNLREISKACRPTTQLNLTDSCMAQCNVACIYEHVTPCDMGTHILCLNHESMTVSCDADSSEHGLQRSHCMSATIVAQYLHLQKSFGLVLLSHSIDSWIRLCPIAM